MRTQAGEQPRSREAYGTALWPGYLSTSCHLYRSISPHTDGPAGLRREVERPWSCAAWFANPLRTGQAARNAELFDRKGFSTMPETLDHPVLTDAQAAVLGALLSRPDSTARELAEMAGTGGSTTAKALVLLEGLGLARRTLYQPTDGKRGAATWQPTAVSLPGPAIEDSAMPGPAEDPTMDVEHVGDGQAESEETSPGEEVEPAAVAEGTAKNVRLASGGLRALVVDLLASRPDVEFTPTSLSHLLGGRSSGAIANCLSILTEQGMAERTSDKPRRYRYLATATDTA